MKTFTTLFAVAAVGYAAMCAGCAPPQYDPAVAGPTEDSAWIRMSGLPRKSGFYKMRDLEDGRLCYLVRINNGRNDDMSLECQYNADEPMANPQTRLLREFRKPEPREGRNDSCTRRNPCPMPKPCLPRWPSCIA